MYGLCALSKYLYLFLFILVLPIFSWAQAQQATVINDGSFVYQDPDFDAPVIDTLKLGAVHNISKTKKGPFYKIRVKPGILGWIADTDVKLGALKIKSSQKLKEGAIPKSDQKAKKRKPFFATRYRGPAVELINYTEETLGRERSANLLFYGMKFNGFHTIFDGEIYTDANILFHVGAPDYYKESTKKNADGFIFIANFLLQTPSPIGKNGLFYYGFGPMLKYSNFNLDVPNGTGTLTYTAADMAAGVLIDLGLAFRWSQFSLRTDAKYYWEKSKYYGLGLSLGWEF